MRSFPLPLKTADDMLELENKLEEDDGVHAFLVSAITAYCTLVEISWGRWYSVCFLHAYTGGGLEI